MKPVTLVLTVLLTLYTRPSSGLLGSCRAARKCCEGKDTDCEVSFKASSNDIILNLNEETCYCDHGCLDMGDCCHDYKDYCGVYDCQVGEWEGWSSCSSDCGEGTQQRNRQVLRPESNGGVSCPDLHQSRKCQVTCKEEEEEEDATHRGMSAHRLSADKHKTPQAIRETAMVLPGKYSQLHNQVESSDSYDVRQNLKTFHREENTDEYCVVFKVEKAMKSCQFNEDTKRIVRGAEVCVSCESKSIRPHLGDRCSGHGLENRVTRFKAVITPGCHGKWVKTAVYDKCPCKSGTDFIFV